jgi:glycosyltransferase involved in cell wall biosynthesis
MAPDSRSGAPSADEPLVSILLATRNGARFLPDALRGIDAQTYRLIELLAVDDGSTDATREILRAFAADRPWVRLLRAEGVGPARARAIGFEASRGALLAIHDDDDVSRPDRIERQVAYLRAHPRTGVVGSAAQIIDERGTVIAPYPVPLSEGAIRRALRRVPPFAHGSVLILRAAYEAAGGFRAPFRCAEDYDLWLRIPERFGLANLPEPLYAWRLHGGNSFTRERDRHIEYLAVARAFAAERTERGADSVALLASSPDLPAFHAAYSRAARLALLRGEAYVRDGRAAEGRRALAAAFRDPATALAALAWWLVSWPVQASPRGRRHRAGRAAAIGP